MGNQRIKRIVQRALFTVAALIIVAHALSREVWP